MPLISNSIPNLVTGVSQQPSSLMLVSACKEMRNAWPSLVSGNQKRPATEHLAKIAFTPVNGLAGHTIDVSSTQRYQVIVTNGDLAIVDLTNNTLKTITFPDGKAYLSASNPKANFRFITIGDYTFITNSQKTVATAVVAEDGTRINPDAVATIYVTQSISNAYYTVYINGVKKAEYLTPKGVDAASSVPDTAVIATEIYNDLIAAGYTVSQTGSTLTITNLVLGDKVICQAGTGDKSMKCFRGSVQSFSDLPPNSKQGVIVKISGSPENQGDDYYVVFKDGLWVETLAYGSGLGLDNSTMPHVLIHNADGTWTFKRHTWKSRIIGDDNSNQKPSFVGFQIHDIFMKSNRLSFLVDENVIHSEANVYENFFRTTAAQLLDSDRIDIAVLSNGTTILYHAVPYNKELLLFSNRAQYRHSYQNYLAPKTIQVEFSTAFNVSSDIRPINMGNSIYFVDENVNDTFMKIWEYYPRDFQGADDADDASASVPEYIPKGANFVTGSNRSKVVVVGTAGDPSSLFVYKYFWIGDRKVQNAWQKWTFADCSQILWAGFSDNYLYMFIQRSDGLNFERIRCDEDVFRTKTDFTVLLDRRSTPLSMSYNSSTDKTTVELRWGTTGQVEVVSNQPASGPNPAVYGLRHTVTVIDSDTVTVSGDITSHNVTVGIKYEWYYEFPDFFLRQPKNSGEVVILDGRVQIRYLTLEYHNCLYFTANVYSRDRGLTTQVFNGFTLGSESGVLGEPSFSSGKFNIPVMNENKSTKIFLTNDSPFHHAFGSAEWSAMYQPTSKRRF